MIDTGTTLPALDLEDSSGQQVSLPQYLGSSGVLLYFMRATTCPICNRHVAELQSQVDAYARRGINVVIAVPEGAETAKAWKASKGISLPVVSGRTGSPYEAIGLGMRVFGAIQQSGTILVDKEGVVRYSHGSTIPTGSYDPAATEAAAEQLAARTR
jgi:peroxiredoxin